MTNQFRKKPVVVEAVQFLAETEQEMLEHLDGCPGWHMQGGDGNGIVIPTLEGEMIASPGDWIIRGVKGEYYPCKPDIFVATYELVIADEERVQDEVSHV